jgi:hydroxypyruvate isomerase
MLSHSLFEVSGVKAIAILKPEESEISKPHCRAPDRDMGSRGARAENCRLGVHNRRSAFDKNLFDRKGRPGGDRASRTFTGIKPNNVSSEQARGTLVDNLRFAAQRLSQEGIRLLVEPINNLDIPGFFVNSTKFFLELTKAVESENLFFAIRRLPCANNGRRP